jgi:methylase of polypeptide subunit release factors
MTGEHDEVADLFAQAVAQGMHAPFALNCDQWGREYAEKAEEFVVPRADHEAIVEALETLRRDVDHVLDSEGEMHYAALRKLRADRRRRLGGQS